MDYLGPVDLTQYFIKSYNITDRDGIVMASTFGNKGVMVEFTFGRKRLNQVITVFLPLILLAPGCHSLRETHKLQKSPCPPSSPRLPSQILA